VRHPLSIGVAANAMGSNSSTRFMRPLIEQADLILLVGTRTNQNGTDSWTLYPRNARFIHIDTDGQEVGRNYQSLRLVGDAKLA
jgi:acetolactate synthase I/II/III large subunit